MQDLEGLEISVKEEISGNAVEVRRKSDKVMATVQTVGGEVMRIICAYGPQSGRPDTKKVCFYDKMANEWDREVLVKSLLRWGISMDMLGNVLRVLKVYMGEWY